MRFRARQCHGFDSSRDRTPPSPHQRSWESDAPTAKALPSSAASRTGAHLAEVLDRFSVHGQLTTSIVVSTPVPLRPAALPRDAG